MIMDLLAFDLDGTLLNCDQRLSEYTCETLEYLKAAGIAYTLATGRTHFAAKPCIANHHFPLRQIFKNGVEWWNPESNTYRHRNFLTPELISKTLLSFNKHQVIPFVFCLDKNGYYKVYHPPLNGQMSDCIAHELENKNQLSLHPIEELSSNALIINISALGHPELVERIVLDSKGYKNITAYSGSDIYNKDAHWLDIHHSGACKGSSLGELKKEIGAKHIIVFGDGDNDLTMFAMADEAYATDNALDHVKDAATNTIGHHNEDGVARYLRERYSL